MKNICIIGVGNLGYRHYQALMNIDFDAHLFLVDTNINAVKSTINSDNYKNPRIKKLWLLSGIDELPNTIDVVIISTNSDVRAHITKQLIENKCVKYILFEKVLFQKISDYHEINDLLSKYGIGAWVNCPLRLYPYYQEIRKWYNDKNIRCEAFGWDIACNTIHFVDLVEWLSHEKLERVVTDSLDNLIIESKRKGFIEVTGELRCEFSGGSTLNMTTSEDYIGHRKLVIATDTDLLEVDETTRKCKKIQEGKSEEYDIKPLYQSELSNFVVKDIIYKHQCQLVSYHESMRQHLMLLIAFKEYLESVSNDYIVNDCVPVT
ncbi:MAG: Gfo/Idh/MocA family oxidoreductase [Gammaproteobacteria bacterium]|jgi:hypothetical protein